MKDNNVASCVFGLLVLAWLMVLCVAADAVEALETVTCVARVARACRPSLASECYVVM